MKYKISYVADNYQFKKAVKYNDYKKMIKIYNKNIIKSKHSSVESIKYNYNLILNLFEDYKKNLVSYNYFIINHFIKDTFIILYNLLYYRFYYTDKCLTLLIKNAGIMLYNNYYNIKYIKIKRYSENIEILLIDYFGIYNTKMTICTLTCLLGGKGSLTSMFGYETLKSLNKIILIYGRY
jgi:hypothetical protein